MEFPLYDQLAHMAEDVPTSVWNYTMNLPTTHVQVVFALVWHHAAVHAGAVAAPSGKKISLPYHGKVFDGNKGVVFRLDDLPADLKRIVGHYIAAVVADA